MFVSLHICQRSYIWQKWDFSISAFGQFTHDCILAVFPVLIMRLLIMGLVHFFELSVPALRLLILIQNIYLSPSLRWCFSIYFSRIQCRRLLNLNALLGRQIRTWISLRKREEMGPLFGVAKAQQIWGRWCGPPQCRALVVIFAERTAAKALATFAAEASLRDMDLKPNCLAKKTVNLWPQIRSLNLTPVVGSRRVSNIEPLHAGLRDPVFGVEQKAHF
jgi:hypothetical protein